MLEAGTYTNFKVSKWQVTKLFQKKLIEARMASYDLWNMTNFHISLNSSRRGLDPNGELLLRSRHYVLRHGTHSCCYKGKSAKEEGRKRIAEILTINTVTITLPSKYY